MARNVTPAGARLAKAITAAMETWQEVRPEIIHNLARRQESLNGGGPLAPMTEAMDSLSLAFKAFEDAAQ